MTSGNKRVSTTKVKSNGGDKFPIVGIGASAGGLEALELFLSNVPIESGMAFVIIQHLSPNYKGMLVELLQRSTTMQVLQAKDRMAVKELRLRHSAQQRSIHPAWHPAFA
jgi:two-component system CheB/CheR fusion protein